MGPTIEVTGCQCYRNPETPRSTSPVSSLSMIGIVWTLTPFPNTEVSVLGGTPFPNTEVSVLGRIPFPNTEVSVLGRVSFPNTEVSVLGRIPFPNTEVSVLGRSTFITIQKETLQHVAVNALT